MLRGKVRSPWQNRELEFPPTTQNRRWGVPSKSRFGEMDLHDSKI